MARIGGRIMNQHLMQPAAVPAGVSWHMAMTQRRRAHVMAALEARRTAHEWLRLAMAYPADAARFMSEARKRREAVRWNLNKARDLDALIAWKAAA